MREGFALLCVWICFVATDTTSAEDRAAATLGAADADTSFGVELMPGAVNVVQDGFGGVGAAAGQQGERPAVATKAHSDLGAESHVEPLPRPAADNRARNNEGAAAARQSQPQGDLAA